MIVAKVGWTITVVAMFLMMPAVVFDATALFPILGGTMFIGLLLIFGTLLVSLWTEKF